MEAKVKRVSLMLGQDQHERLSQLGLNVSGLVRDLLNDYLSDNVIALHVSPETKELYDKIVANTGSTDVDLEPYLVEALREMLNHKIGEMEKLKKKLSKK